MSTINKIIISAICLAISSSSLSTNALAQEEMFSCESTVIGMPEIVDQTIELVDYLLEVNMKMPYDYVFTKIDRYERSAVVVEGYELNEGEILEIGEQLSLKDKIFGEFSKEEKLPQKIIFNEEGYEYVRPAVFAKYTTVKVPVNEQVKEGMCLVEPQWSYIEYPVEFLLDGVFSD